MRDRGSIKRIFEHYGGMMRTAQLTAEKVYYKDILRLMQEGYIEKVRWGYYQWTDAESVSEVVTVTRLFPDGIFCMNTALRYYGYSNRTPREWHLAVNKYANRTRFSIDYPFVRPYYIEPKILELGLCEQTFDGATVRMYDISCERCVTLKFRLHR